MALWQGQKPAIQIGYACALKQGAPVSHTLFKFFAALMLTATLPAQAFQIVSVSPQGEVARIRQVVAKFDDVWSERQ